MIVLTATRTATPGPGKAFRLAAIAGMGMAAALGLTGAALAQASDATELRKLCKADYSKHCAGILPGGGAIRDCMVANIDKLSAQCRSGLEECRKNATAKPKS